MEIARRFANRDDLLEVFERVRQRCGTGTDEPANTARSDRSADYRPWQRLLTERFSAERLEEMVNAYRNGMRQREVVAHFGISPSALKRLLKEQGARRCDG